MGIYSNFFRFFDARIKYITDLNRYKKYTEEKNEIFKYNKKNINRQLYDRYENAGSLDAHYFLQDLYVANCIINDNTKVHYDIGSRIDGFLAHLLSADILVYMIDIRPLDVDINNLKFIKGNATDLNGIADGTIDSLSSLHALEHFGLGRYGDQIDPQGWNKALNEYARILKKNGVLYLSVPIGYENKLCFNAHRIFYPKTIVEAISSLKLEEFVYIKNMKLIVCDDYNKYDEKEDYLCGIFKFTKI